MQRQSSWETTMLNETFTEGFKYGASKAPRRKSKVSLDDTEEVS